MFMRRLRYWLGSTKREAALRAEMESHLEEKAAELRDGGLDESDARAEAQRRFGNLGLKQEESREIWIARYWSDFWQDLRYGARNLRRNPGVTAVAILSAALGIGACSTVFSIVNFSVFRPLPVAEPDRLMTIMAMHRSKGVASETLSFLEIQDLRNQARSWQGVAAFAPFLPVGIGQGGDARRHWGFLVTANYFDVVKPAFLAGGGFIHGEDDIPGAPAKIVLTHALWRNRFGADSEIIGRNIQVNKRAMTVVGVTAPGFRGTEVGIAADFFLPCSQISEMDMLKSNSDRLTSYSSQWLVGLGRLKPGIDLRRAKVEIETVAAGVRERVPSLERDRGFYIERAGQLMAGLRRIAMPAFLLLLTITFLVLLTACANVANLMLARASARSREIATRLAIGAGRGRIIRQLMTESLLLALSGGAMGVALALWGGRLITGFRLPLPLPVDLSISVDHRVILFSVSLSIVTGMAFGLVPAFRATQANLIGSIRSDAGNNIASLRRFGLRNALVVAQVAISAVLVICSGLFLRSLGAARGIDSGMDARNVVLVRFDPALSRHNAQQTARLLLDVLRDAEAQPGVQSASVTNGLPLSVGGNFTLVGAEGHGEGHQGERAAVMAVGPHYFETMGIRLLVGADFRPVLSKEPTAIVNQELARRLYPNQDPFGRYLLEGGQRVRIVGVVANSKYRMLQESEVTPILYRPILDTYVSEGSFAGLTLIARSAQDSPSLSGLLRQMLLKHDPELVVNLAGTMESHLQASMFLSRLAASLFGLCGGMGLLIASIGVYGVISFAVARRAREIGIRMALGARSSQVVKMVLWHGAAISLVGIVIGIAGGLALARVARNLIYGVSASDPVTFISVPLILLSVALLATAIPARRAAMLDPNRTLRAD